MFTSRSRLKPNKKEKKEEYITTSGLRERGWTAKLIRDFAGNPDKTERNPVYKSAAPMRLYLLKRIKRIENTKKFRVASEKSKKRKESALRSADKKRQRTIEYATNLVIRIPIFTKEKLIAKACKSYNDFQMLKMMERGGDYDYEPATPDSDIKFLSRICTNFLRHKCTKYEKALDNMFGNVGVQEGHDIIKRRVNEAIFETYEWIDRDYNTLG
jgi:hypothetical protein